MSEGTPPSRRRTLRTIGSVVLAGLAGCSTSGSPDSARAATETPTSGPSDTHSGPHTSQHPSTETANEHTSTEPPGSAQFVENPKEVHATLVEETSVPSDEVLIGLRLEDSTLPFTTEVYPAPDDAEIQATKTYDTQDLGQVDLVPEPPRALDTVDTDREDVHYGTTTIGEPLVVTLVARHDGETFDWSAWERTGYPHGGGDVEDPVMEVDCYCGGRVYTAPGGGTWARVIQVTPTEGVDTGTTVALNWTSSRV